ncbi:glyceraldehyde-3-phosphate dehydrogenase, testis-specific-like [Hibiscus syriacus]|uniref:glyceraldehyde-3-phosphate dehydrogenase, testis-specific-like n=1 Tax=Hibiscus syriacus TaxID=106335 RepID=UPI0019218357|nr:glyceraldehyde-3-phosphate dehydrogenase, testis-specific-like [Hibiscus syriacus]
MSGHPYYSPPPPPPPSPPTNCTPQPPPPPPKCNPCPCVYICEFTQLPPPPNNVTPAWAPIPPPPLPPSPSPDHTVILAVSVSLGGAFFIAFLAVGLFCLAKRRKKVVIIPPPVEATACVEEHQHIEETITTSPCGDQTVTVTVDDDVRVHEAVVEPLDYDRPSYSHADGHLKTG